MACRTPPPLEHGVEPQSRKSVRQTPALSVRYRPIAELLPNPTNPRVHSAKQVNQLARSIQAFGFLVPVPVDEGDQLVSGHGRCLAAAKLGMTEVPVLRVSHLTASQKAAFQIADNQLTINAEWNPILLGEQFSQLAAAEAIWSAHAGNSRLLWF